MPIQISVTAMGKTFAFTVPVDATVTEDVTTPAPAPSVPVTPPTTYPVLCADPARTYAWWADTAKRDQALAFTSQHVGLTESHARSFMPSTYKGLTWFYALDLSVMLVDDQDMHDANALPDYYFIRNPSGTRYTQVIWGSNRWFWDFSNPYARGYVINRLREKCAGYDCLFLDEHFEIIGQPTSLVVQFLHELKAALPGKYIIVNTSQASVYPGYREQALAAGSFDAEVQWGSGAMRGWAFADWAKLIGEVSAGGGISLLTGSVGYAGPHGDYNRELMWRLAAYWMVKGPGVYLDLMSWPADANDLSFKEWAKCMEFDLGKPVSEMVATSYGKHGSAFDAVVFSREFEKGWVYLRGQDGWDVNDYGDASAVQIPLLSTPLPILQVDGTFKTAATVYLRTADSAILVKP